MSISFGAVFSVYSKAKLVLPLLGFALLAGCDDAGNFDISQVLAPKPESGEQSATPNAAEFTERDVEAPNVFQAAEPGLWDGRPSLGGVWVAHPDVKDPERVMIRNKTNGKFVVGALFRREREIPGPRLQISSDAAVALDVLAGAPVELEVVALRKEKVPVAQPAPEAATVADAGDAPTAAPAEVTESTLDPIAAASAAIDSAEPTAAETAAAAPQAPAIQSTLPLSRLEKPYIQVGIFNQSANAEVAADQMRSAGMIPTVLEQESNGKPFWRVIVGPAGTASERTALRDKIKEVGYTDAYPVTN